MVMNATAQEEIKVLGKRGSIVFTGVLLTGMIFLGAILLYNNWHNLNIEKLSEVASDRSFWTMVGVGFLAQMIDGALGMAYGVSCSSFLVSIGLSPAVASAAVHTAEVFTTASSGLSHLKLKNINKKLALSLIIPGVIGAIVGSYLLSSDALGKTLKPFVAVYLIVMGCIVIYKAFKLKHFINSGKVAPLALSGGFLDAIGGGGWGPVVTSTLLSRGNNPRYTIGSVNLAEFFIAFASATTFIFALGSSNVRVILALILGGVIASPFGALLVGRVKTKYLMLAVGILIIAVNIRTLVLYFQ